MTFLLLLLLIAGLFGAAWLVLSRRSQCFDKKSGFECFHSAHSHEGVKAYFVRPRDGSSRRFDSMISSLSSLNLTPAQEEDIQYLSHCRTLPVGITIYFFTGGKVSALHTAVEGGVHEVSRDIDHTHNLPNDRFSFFAVIESCHARTSTAKPSVCATT